MTNECTSWRTNFTHLFSTSDWGGGRLPTRGIALPTGMGWVSILWNHNCRWIENNILSKSKEFLTALNNLIQIIRRQIINARHAIWPRSTDRRRRHISPEVAFPLAQSFLCKRTCCCSEALSPERLAKEPEAEGSTEITLPHPAPGLTAGLSCSQAASVLSCAPLIWELHVVRHWTVRMNKMGTSTQHKM